MRPQKTCITIALFFSLLANTACSADKSSSIKTTKPVISANTGQDNDSELDILKDYDRDIWDGPDGWTDEQRRWKRLLRWSKDCDYVGEVTTYPLSEHMQIVQVMCVPGSYQGMYYLYLFNQEDKSSKQLALGLQQSSDNPFDVWGNISFNPTNKHIEILTLSRGAGDCGTYRVFKPDTQHSTLTLIERRERQCGSSPLPDNPDDTIFDYKNWPITK